MTILRLTLLISALLFTSCANRPTDLNQFYKPLVLIKQKTVKPSDVSFEEFPFDSDKNVSLSIVGKGYLVLGKAEFSGPAASPHELQKLAGTVGGDLIVYGKKFIRTERGARMVLSSYTPPSLGYSTATASGYSYGGATANTQTPWGPVVTNTTGYINNYGTASSSTFNPGQSTYVRQEFDYPVFNQCAVVFQSPQGQVKNWANIEKATGNADDIFNFEEFITAYKSNYKSLSPQRKALADAIESGRKFNQTTAKQFLFNQFMMNEQKTQLSSGNVQTVGFNSD